MKTMFVRTLWIVLVILTFGIPELARAQNDRGGEETTWYDSLKTKQTEMPPGELRLLSIQVSKLPRDTFGHGKPPYGHGFVDSFVAASGTGLYGSFSLDYPGVLKWQEDLSTLERFKDDSGKDLTTNPTKKEVNEFFDGNKALNIASSQDGTKINILFTLRGLSTPTPGTTALTSRAKVVFLALSNEKSETIQIEQFEPRQEVEVGPVRFSIHKDTGAQSIFRTGRTVNPAFGEDKREWGLLMAARAKPVKEVQLLDDDGMVITTLQGIKFGGKSHRYYLEPLSAQPKSIRATWYDKWELITVPLEIETTLGI